MSVDLAKKYGIEERIIKSRGSLFKIKNAPIWKGHTGEVLEIWENAGGIPFVTGLMDNGSVGEWRLSSLEFLKRKK